MARGWASKSVEDQVEVARAEREFRGERPPTTEERELRAQRQTLELSRAQFVARLESARDDRYREQLRLALTHLDAELAKLAK